MIGIPIEAVADARDDDAFTFDPASREIVNVTQSRTYQPVPLTSKEDEIRRSGGIFAIGRREFRSSVERTPEVIFPDASLARGMSTTEAALLTPATPVIHADGRYRPFLVLLFLSDR